MDPGKDHLFVAALSQSPHFINDNPGIHAAASAANRRDYAKRAISVAPILHFDDRSRTPTRSEMSPGLKFLFQKNAAAKNLCATRGEIVLVQKLKGEPADQRLVRIARHVAHVRQGRDFLGSALGVATRDDDLSLWVS